MVITAQFARTFLTAVLIAVPLSASAESAPQPRLASLIAAAKAEDEIDLVAPLTGGQAEIDAWVAGYTRLYGYRPNVVVSPTADMPSVAAKIVQEHQAGRPNTLDAIIGSEAHLLLLARQDALRAADWSGLSSVKADYIQADGRAVTFLSIVRGVTYTPRR